MTSPELTVSPLTADTADNFETVAERDTPPGVVGHLDAARFTEVARPRRDRPVMRYELP